MFASEDLVRSLREALRATPDNAALRRCLAEALAGLGRLDQAEAEFRRALALAPKDEALQVGLADLFFRRGEDSKALVIVESLLKADPTPGRALVLHARLLLKSGDVEQAVRQYKRGVEADPEAADPEMEQRLGTGPDDGAREVVDGRLRAAPDGEGAPEPEAPERPSIGFADVGGMEGVKDEIRMKIVAPMEHPELFKAYGKSAGGGILMYGPPGCGKTLLARATAGEIKAGFLSVGIESVLDMWIGSSERNLHEWFESARRHAPCVLFFDEADALGASRSDMRASAGRHLINQFLAELDGVRGPNEGVLVLAATNAPWHLDPAFRRPGRFDRVLFVPPPDAPARAEVLRVLCRGRPCGTVDFAALAKRTDGFSGADLKAVVDLAVEAKLREALRDGTPKPLETADLAAAAKTVKPSTKEWFATARNYVLYANQAGLYDDVRKYLKL
ncbi:MAG: AAA family ATPase [Planctomycetes bacterium]|jgi:SpoVK/Ycf46/Vps4 family AAA+-type ATPase|nr:AAA family ATPase [Planctomycetota bacterium]